MQPHQFKGHPEPSVGLRTEVVGVVCVCVLVGVLHKQRGLMLSPDDFWVLSGNNPLTTCAAGIKASISVPGACSHLTISVGDINACRHLLGFQ